jgi:hypothetical protein
METQKHPYTWRDLYRYNEVKEDYKRYYKTVFRFNDKQIAAKFAKSNVGFKDAFIVTFQNFNYFASAIIFLVAVLMFGFGFIFLS